MANAVEGSNGGGGGGGRAARLPRWTRQEILVLIEGKRVVEGRTGRGRGPGRAGLTIGGGSSGPLEPKWAAVAAYCRRHGVNRGPVQCRKRWSNLAGDYKKIKEWERGRSAAASGGGESFWVMRNDVRREKRLPGFFDKEVYDILDGATAAGAVVVAAEAEEEVVFDSGRSAADDGLFSEGDEEKETGGEEEEDDGGADAEERAMRPPAAVVPISGKMDEACAGGRFFWR